MRLRKPGLRQSGSPAVRGTPGRRADLVRPRATGPAGKEGRPALAGELRDAPAVGPGSRSRSRPRSRPRGRRARGSAAPGRVRRRRAARRAEARRCRRRRCRPRALAGPSGFCCAGTSTTGASPTPASPCGADTATAPPTTASGPYTTASGPYTTEAGPVARSPSLPLSPSTAGPGLAAPARPRLLRCHSDGRRLHRRRGPPWQCRQFRKPRYPGRRRHPAHRRKLRRHPGQSLGDRLHEIPHRHHDTFGDRPQHRIGRPAARRVRRPAARHGSMIGAGNLVGGRPYDAPSATGSTTSRRDRPDGSVRRAAAPSWPTVPVTSVTAAVTAYGRGGEVGTRSAAFARAPQRTPHTKSPPANSASRTRRRPVAAPRTTRRTAPAPAPAPGSPAAEVKTGRTLPCGGTAEYGSKMREMRTPV